jgi:hypothetical protein
MAKTLNGQGINICFSNKTHIYKVKAACQIEYNIEEFDQQGEYELKVGKNREINASYFSPSR